MGKVTVGLGQPIQEKINKTPEVIVETKIIEIEKPIIQIQEKIVEVPVVKEVIIEKEIKVPVEVIVEKVIEIPVEKKIHSVEYIKVPVEIEKIIEIRNIEAELENKKLKQTIKQMKFWIGALIIISIFLGVI